MSAADLEAHICGVLSDPIPRLKIEMMTRNTTLTSIGLTTFKAIGLAALLRRSGLDVASIDPGAHKISQTFCDENALADMLMGAEITVADLISLLWTEKNRALMPDDKSLLLDLPAELRNLVYKSVLEHEPNVILHPLARGQLVAQSPLARVCRQIRQELLPLVHASELPVIALVDDFDFAHLITWLNKLADSELATFRHIPESWCDGWPETLPSRRVCVELRFHTSTLYAPHVNRWMKRLVTAKKGAGLHFLYSVSEIARPDKIRRSWSYWWESRFYGYESQEYMIENINVAFKQWRCKVCGGDWEDCCRVVHEPIRWLTGPPE